MEETQQTPQGSGMNQKTVMIVIGVVIVLGIIAYLMGFFGGTTMFAPAGYMPGVDADKNMDGSTTYTTDEGSVTVGGNSMPASWPSDAPTAYAGAQIIYSGDSNPTTGQSGSAVMYTTSASVESVLEYYTSRLTAEGWTIEGTVNTGGMTALSAKKGERTFGAYISTADGKTQVTAGVEGI